VDAGASTTRGTPTVDTWWLVAAFRAYAAHTRTSAFHKAVTGVLDRVATATVAVMCSESVWWRCRRRLIADVAALAHDVEVHHLMADGRVVPHRPTEGARVRDDGAVVWDGPRTAGG